MCFFPLCLVNDKMSSCKVDLLGGLLGRICLDSGQYLTHRHFQLTDGEMRRGKLRRKQKQWVKRKKEWKK